MTDEKGKQQDKNKEPIKKSEVKPEAKPAEKLEAKPEVKPETKLEPKKREFSKFNVGDTVKVYVKIQESEDKFRLQPFEGLVLRKRGSGDSQTFTVRKISYGEGVERIFPLSSPSVDNIEVVRKGKVRKSKLYYMRSLRGKAYKVEEKET